MTLAIDEFIPPLPDPRPARRLPSHPHYGLFANGGRTDNIAPARQLLNVKVAHAEPGDASETEPQTLSHPCPCCGERMIIIQTFEPGCRPRYRSTVPSQTDSS
jgi:hypothetical protein